MYNVETEESRRAEAEVIAVLCAQWGSRAKKMHMKFCLDYMVFKANKATSWVEVKNRPDWDGYETYMLSFHKWMRAHQYLTYSRLPTILAVRLAGQLMTYNVSPLDLGQVEIIEGGRRDREKSGDIEPCVLIPIERFSLFDEDNELWDGPLLPITYDLQDMLTLSHPKK